MSTPITDAQIEELLGAYVLDACEPEERVVVEELLRRRADLTEEVERLADAAAWIGSTEALTPPARLRGALFERIQRPQPPADPPARLYAAEADRVAAEFDRLDPDDDDVRTPNGLTARQLVAHVAAHETMLARAIDHPVEDIDVVDVEARTAQFVERYATRPFTDVVDVWRQAVDVVVDWCGQVRSHDATVEWLGMPLPRDGVLVARAFENWLHRDDLRRVRGELGAPPPGPEMHLMADLAMGMLTPALALSGKSRPGHSARLVLTGDGGGEWLVPLDLGSPPTEPPAVTLTADVVDWCLVAGERLAGEDLVRTVDGDVTVADDLVAAASAFAVL